MLASRHLLNLSSLPPHPNLSEEVIEPTLSLIFLCIKCSLKKKRNWLYRENGFFGNPVNGTLSWRTDGAAYFLASFDIEAAVKS